MCEWGISRCLPQLQEQKGSNPSAHPSPRPQQLSHWRRVTVFTGRPLHHRTPCIRTSSLLTPTHFFVLCIRNLEETLLGMKPKYSFIKSYFFAIKYLCLKSCPLSPRGLNPFWRRPSTHVCVCVCVFWFIWRSGLVQRCCYSIVTVEISFLHPRKYPSLTLKTNLLLLALSRFRMRLLRVCLAFRFSHSFPLSLPRNLCLAAPLQTLECQEGRGDRFDSNRTMKRTWSNYFQNRVYLGPLLFTLFLSLSAPTPHPPLPPL